MSSKRKPNRSAHEIALEKAEKARKKQEREERKKEKQEKEKEKKANQAIKKEQRNLKKQAEMQERAIKQEIENMRLQEIETSRQQILLTYPILQEIVHILQKWDWNTNIGAELMGYVKPGRYVWIVSPGSISPPPPKINYDPDEVGIKYYLNNCV